MDDKVKQAAKRLVAEDKLLTLEQLSHQVLTPAEFKLYSVCTAAWYEDKDMNALTYFSSEANSGSIAIIMDGFEQLLDRAWERYKQFMMTGQQVVHIHHLDTTPSQFVVYSNDAHTMLPTRILANRVYLCTSLEHLKNIQFSPVKLQTQMKLVQSLAFTVSSIRCYVLFKSHVNLKELNSYTVGQIIGRWWIKMNRKTVMIYCDGAAADALNAMSDAHIINNFVQQLNRVYHLDLTPDDVSRVIKGYWKHAIDVLSPKYFYHTKLLSSLPFVCTSITTPEDQGWMNGHLVDLHQ